MEQTEKKESSASCQDKKKGNKGASRQIDDEKLIPLGGNRVKEYSEHFSDF